MLNATCYSSTNCLFTFLNFPCSLVCLFDSLELRLIFNPQEANRFSDTFARRTK